MFASILCGNRVTVASTLVQQSLDAMKENGVEEVRGVLCVILLFASYLCIPFPFLLKVVLETEYDNTAALSLYESLGFIREKRLYRFYMNGKDAFRLILAIPPSGTGSASSSYSDSGDASAVLHASQAGRRQIQSQYLPRVIPDFIAGYDDEDDDEVSMR